jgi:hypothetical protein
VSIASMAAASKSSPRREGAGCRSAAAAAGAAADAAPAAGAATPVVRRILELPARLRASTSCRMNLRPRGRRCEAVQVSGFQMQVRLCVSTPCLTPCMPKSQDHE